ncbi:SMP-30/gluconolactonase/LRE family protein [Fulvivirgaceae bacterium PWU4]|uniref:SMP-30/gluconolactonase/LRE family protein n=1 Tax=Chryseosolibacter histidini TaxID=2782349 RepID=A0AAP2DIA2_9BACT|nr:SMP-30/gluconolactonase/LRE family protein [Chryseosolibacter histidini]MBT1696675.1 SMP-30/gluconolactonase/LRE family protein [Chryseosolibacter histidini]
MKGKLLILLLLFFVRVIAQQNTETYPVDPASEEHAGVPKGEILKLTFTDSKIFPGTTREISVYIPAQYKADNPACVYVNQDGIQWKAPTVFDNLIAKREMPVTIGVFVSPGKVPAPNNEAVDRFNRSFEYDGLGDRYARFLLEEVFPFVESQKTADGRAIRLSTNGNDRAIGGSSSGAVCAFTVAWEMPEQFSRVFSAIGTYVGLRGADRYDILVRKYEPKPIRVFMQDGSGDLNIYAGDWWKANESMERALTFAGYDVDHVWGNGGHNGQHGTAVFPQAMRWLWRDHPNPVRAGQSKNQFLTDILAEGNGWELVGENYGFTEGIAVNAKGEVFFQDIPNAKTYKIGQNGKPELYISDSKKASGTTFSTSGDMITITGGWSEPPTKQVHRYKTPGVYEVVADETPGNDITVAFNGNTYVTSPDGRERPSKLYLIKPNGEKRVVDEGLKFANGLCLSADQTQLYVTESATHWVWVYQVQPDGTLSHKQKYGWLHVRDVDENAWSDGLKSDRDGRIYVTSLSGIQVMDQLGRVNAIIPVPKTKGQASNLCFGGPGFDILYVTCHDKVFRRKVKVKGANNFEKPVKPNNPRL